MIDAPQYLDGFLAAVRPGQDRPADRAPEADPLPAVADAPQASEESFPFEEQSKRRLYPLDSFARLLDCAETNRPPEAEDRYRFQWFGLFYQAPWQDAFLLRLRLPGGRLKAFQLVGLAEIVQEYGSGYLLLNGQGGLDVPGVPVRAATEILQRAESIGLNARQTGGDCVQCVRGGEDDDLTVRGHSGGPIFPLVCKLEQALMHNRVLADLPRPCEIVFQRPGERLEPGGSMEIDTLVLQAMPNPAPLRDGNSGDQPVPSFLVIVPGVSAGGFLLQANRVVSGCLALLEAWARGGDRTSRTRAGLAEFCAALAREQISVLLDHAPWYPLQSGSRLLDERSQGGVVIPEGRLLSGQLILIEKILRAHGLDEVRFIRGSLHPALPLNEAASESVRLALVVA